MGNPTWYLGPDHAGIDEDIVAFEQYNVDAIGSPRPWRGSAIVAIVTVVIGSPLLLLRVVGVLLLFGLVTLTTRAARRAWKKPNDILIALTATKVYVFDAVSTLRRGWQVQRRLGEWPRGQLQAEDVAARYIIRLRLPGFNEDLQLAPSTGGSDAATIAKALSPLPR